jgi:integrase
MVGGDLSPYNAFVYSIHSEFTKKLYVKHLKNYMHFRFGVRGGEERDYDKLLGEPRLIQSQIIEYVIYLKEERELTSASIRSVTSALRRFYEMNDLELKWKKIHPYVGHNKRKSRDRPYTKEEISRFLEKADQRERVIILIMCSTGMRVGALPSLKIRNLEQVEKYELYKITAYENENEEYVTICTPECRNPIDSYLEYRKRQGERLKDDGPLIREEFDITDELHVANPRPMSVETLRGLIKRLGAMSGVIEKKAQIKDENKKTERRPVMGTHGFRKFFETTAIKSGMTPLYVWMLMGQKSGLESAYFKPTIDELLEGNDKMIGYASLIDILTINEENRLRQKVKQLKSREEDDIAVLKSQVNTLTATLENISQNFLLKMPTPTEKRIMEDGRIPTTKELEIIKKEGK